MSRATVGALGLLAFGVGIVRSKTAFPDGQRRDSVGDVLVIGGILTALANGTAMIRAAEKDA
jgi:hypothetical protein